MSAIGIDKDDTHIFVSCPWSPDSVEYCKSVHGARFNKSRTAWQYPLDWNTCLQIRKKIATPMKMKLEFTPEMRAWAEAERDRQAQIPDTMSQELVDLPWIRQNRPDMWAAFESRPFQSVGVKFGMETQRYILADYPGLGKTLQTLAVMEEMRVTGVILVVANTSAQQVSWPKEIERWTEDEYLVFEANIKAEARDYAIQQLFDECREDPTKRIWVLMNPFWVRYKAEVDKYGNYIYDVTGKHKDIRCEVPELFKHKWAAVIADESQETLACNTGNKKKQSMQRQGMGELVVKPGGQKISISGTPMRGKPENMYGQLSWLYPERYTSFWKWAKEHFVVTEGEGPYGAMEIGSLKDPDAFYRELEPIMIRRDKAMVAADLPPKMYGGHRYDPDREDSVIGVWLPMTGPQKKMYDKFVDASVIEDESGKTMDAIGVLAQYTRMKQLATAPGRVDTKLVDIVATYEDNVYEVETDEDGEEYQGEIIHAKGDPILDERGRKTYLEDEFGERLKQEVDYFQPVIDKKLKSNKYEWLLEWLKERDLLGANARGTGKVIIASQFRQVVDTFRELLATEQGVASFCITGATSPKERVHQQNEFQENPNSPKLFFLQSQAGGTSLTLDQADDVILLDEYWNPDTQEQIEDRAHRLSNVNHSVTIWYVRSLESIEEYIGTTVDERRTVMMQVMDGSRGVDFRKKLRGK